MNLPFVAYPKSRQIYIASSSPNPIEQTDIHSLLEQTSTLPKDGLSEEDRLLRSMSWKDVDDIDGTNL